MCLTGPPALRLAVVELAPFGSLSPQAVVCALEVLLPPHYLGRWLPYIAAGLAVGLPLAWGFARLMASLVFGVAANDAATFVSIPLALVVAASLAIYIPARRATKIDPIVALRYE